MQLKKKKIQISTFSLFCGVELILFFLQMIPLNFNEKKKIKCISLFFKHKKEISLFKDK